MCIENKTVYLPLGWAVGSKTMPCHLSWLAVGSSPDTSPNKTEALRSLI